MCVCAECAGHVCVCVCVGFRHDVLRCAFFAFPANVSLCASCVGILLVGARTIGLVLVSAVCACCMHVGTGSCVPTKYCARNKTCLSRSVLCRPQPFNSSHALSFKRDGLEGESQAHFKKRKHFELTDGWLVRRSLRWFVRSFLSSSFPSNSIHPRRPPTDPLSGCTLTFPQILRTAASLLRCCAVLCGMAWRGVAWRGVAWRGTVVPSSQRRRCRWTSKRTSAASSS